jgi:hypothetical protein
MADTTLSEDPPRRHALAGRKQSAEHIAKRMSATARAKASWSPEQYATWYAANSAANRINGQKPEVRAANARKKVGSTPWTKGNRWQDKFSPEEVRAITAKRARDRRAKSPKRKLNERIRALVGHSLRGNKGGRSWEALVGYTFEQLQKRLTRTMPAGYSWADIGELHVDHIIPVSAFNFTTSEDIDFKRCWALSNLQLLPKADNLKKKATLKRPFQPSLSLYPLSPSAASGSGG